MSEYFQVGDVISIDNADRPVWLDGRWRVVSVQRDQNGCDRIRLQPLRADGTVDEDRDAARSYWITGDGQSHDGPSPVS